MSTFPIVDLAAFERADAADKRRMGQEVDQICRTSGFLAIRNHGIPDAIIDSVW
eukprot:gene59849-biopygen43239